MSAPTADVPPEPDAVPFAELVRACDTGAVRAWARAEGLQVSRTGGLPRFVYEDYLASRRP
jgi:hypothetical protein